ncbi:hypothetical protein cypCar_00024209 [Cyprinus carpio]|nr:hypothetical protein cypCar_00024209 [Cyprinus carpio]
MGTCTSQESRSSGVVRIKHSLNKNEEEFVVKRRKIVLKSLQKLKIHCSKINEHRLTGQRNKHNKDPFPIYTVIDKQCKQNREGDPWFEISPHEAGYSLIGAFVETSSFGSQFYNGRKIKDQPEIDMLYLQDPNSPPVGKCSQVLMDLVDMNLSVLNGIDPFDLHESIRTNLNDKTVPRALLESETRDYIDAGVLQNSPYFSVLREERDIDLIISLDFSDGDPFMTVREAAETCRKRKIPFPEVNIPDKDVKKPKDFYVFKGKNTPTVIHIPLFNVVNCGDDIDSWRYKYMTFSGPYNAEKISKLMEVAGRNISNNRAKLLKHIRAAIGQKHNKQHCD